MPSDAFFSATKPASAVFAPPSTTRPSAPGSPRWKGLRSALAGVFRREPTGLLAEPPLSTPGESDVGTTNVAPRSPSPERRSESRTPAPEFITTYFRTLDSVWRDHDWRNVVLLNETLLRCWKENRQVFLCGNGGSAANAIHLANDLLYGVDKHTGRGLRVTALSANASVLTCLANDISYEHVFAQQLAVLSNPGDVLIALSGSGNSPNILKALTRACQLRVTTFAILGFTGGRARELADHPIHFPVYDMQIAEDLQTMVGHMAMQWLSRQPRR